MDFAAFGFDCVTEMCNSNKSEINQYSNGNDFGHGFHLPDMSNIGSAGLYESFSGQASSYSEPKTVESQTDQNPAISVCSEDTAMDHQNSELWMYMDENSRQLERDDNDPQIIGSNPSTKTYNSGGPVVQRQQQRQTSKNLYTERKRRTKLKETLYKLRSVVPKISKMDKQSIVGDAISCVLDLQKKVREIEDEIQALSSSKRPDNSQVITAETTKPRTNTNSDSIKSADLKKSAVKLIKHGKLLEVDICNVGEEGIYHVRIESKKEAGGLVKLTRALESLPLHIMNSNICCFDEAILSTVTLNASSMEIGGADKLEDMIRQSISSAWMG
jgi:hypothetical protein